MDNNEELRELVERYCDPCLERVEWSPRSGKLRWDFLSRRCDRLSGEDWVARFGDALAACDDITGLQVNLPMETRQPAGPAGCGAWFWAETDARVFAMLRERGAEFPFPKFDEQAKRDEPDNDALVRFYLFCPPTLAEPVLASVGASLESLDFTGDDVEGLLKLSGNPRAYRWMRANRPDCLHPESFSLEELCDTPLIEPLLEEVPDGSVCDDRVVEAGVAFAKRLMGAASFASALGVVRKLKLREAHLVELLGALSVCTASDGSVAQPSIGSALTGDAGLLSDNEASDGDASLSSADASMPGDSALSAFRGTEAEAFRFLERLLAVELVRLRSLRTPTETVNGKRVALNWDDELTAEFLAFARRGDVDSLSQFMEGVGAGALPGCGEHGRGAAAPAEHVRLWRACVERLDAPLLQFLMQHGMDLPSVLQADKHVDESNTLVRNVANVCDGGRFGVDQARAFIMAAVDAGVRLDGNGSREAMQLLCLFPGDERLFERLSEAGFSFHVDDGDGPMGSGDARVVGYLLSTFHKRVTCEWDSPAVLQDKKADWDAAAYVLSHGARLQVDGDFAGGVRRTLQNNPEKLADLAKAVPPQAIRPTSFVVGQVSASGGSAVLDVLQRWRDSFDDDTLREAIDACVQLGLTEATAYCMDLAGGAPIGCAQSLEL